MDKTDKTDKRVIRLGGAGVREVVIGAGDLSVQSMWKESIKNITDDDIKKIVLRLEDLHNLGCDIMRFAVPDIESAENLNKISLETEMPLVADIHFDPQLALKCLSLDSRVAAIRINPGNIGDKDKVALVASACKNKNVPIRIGVNSGSIEKPLQKAVINGEMTHVEALVESAINEGKVLEDMGFFDYVVSIKASSGEETVKANEIFRERSLVPLHIGVTESGPLITGVVKSALALGDLLKRGIGDTIRVSLSDTVENEIIAGRTILEECGLRRRGVTLISCPRCGRMGFDVHGFMARWQEALLSNKKLNDAGLTIAVMGCVVNGVGEGRAADLGVSGSGDNVVFFKKGEIIKTLVGKTADYVDNLFRELLETLE